MDVRQLRYFISILENRSFTKAASVLRIAQPALGLQMRKLEEELNSKLLVRHSRGVEPTEAGLILLDRARKIIEQVDDTRNAIRDLAPVLSGRIVLGMSPSISAMLAYPLVSAASEELPNVSLVLVDELSPVLAEWLSTGRLDIALGYDILHSSNVMGDPLLVENLFLVQGADAKRSPKKTIPMSSLANFELLAPGVPHALRSLLEYKSAELGIELNIKFEVQSVHVIKELVERGIGATILPYGAVHRECQEGRLFASKIVDPEIRRTAYLAHSARRAMTNAEESLTRLIRDIVRTQARPHSQIWESATPLVESGAIHGTLAS